MAAGLGHVDLQDAASGQEQVLERRVWVRSLVALDGGLRTDHHGGGETTCSTEKHDLEACILGDVRVGQDAAVG